MFENPILAKELKSTLRSKKALGILMFYMMVLSLTVLVFWPTAGVLTLSAQNSRQLFTYFFTGELILILLFSPAFASTAITSEKEAESFPMVFCSLLTPFDICTGKLLSSVSFLVLLIFAALPLVSVCFLLGSVSMGDMLLAMCVLGVTAITFGLLGILFSAIFDRSSRSLFVSYMAVIVIAFLLLAPGFVFNAFKGLQYPFHFIRSCSPISAMLSVVQPNFWQHLGEKPLKGVPDAYVIYFGFCAVICAVSIFYVGRVLRKPPSVRVKKRGDEDSRNEKDGKGGKKKLGFPFYLINPNKPGKYIGNWSNPMFVKELKSKFFGRISNMIRGVTACFIFSLTLVIVVSSGLGVLSSDAVKIVGVAFQLGVVIFLSPVLTAGLITQEIEQSTFDMIRMSPMSAWTIIWGKLKSSFFYLLILVVASGPFFFMLIYLDVGDYSRTLYCAGMIISAMFFGTSTGLFCSAFSKRTGAAMATSYAIMLTICVGTLLILLVSDKVSAETVHIVLGINPFVGTLSLVCDDILTDYPYWKISLATMWGVSGVFFVASVIRIMTMLRSKNG